MLHITKHETNKLEGFLSINTSVLNNDFCGKMRLTDSVCKKCYAANMEKRYLNLHNAISKNDTLLSSSLLTTRQLPIFNARAVRLHSLGELINDIHFANFCAISAHNPDTLFVLWTKRKAIINEYLKSHDKPVNLSLVYSSPKVDKIARLPKHFDKVFTAHNKKTIADINCHGKCKDCLLCYTFNNVKEINEVLK